MKAFAYDRVSTARQATNVDLETRYLDAITGLCSRRGWTLEGTFTDAGLSGKNANRPGLQAAMNAAIEARAVIVFYDLTRFSRSMQDLLTIADTLKQHGAAIVSATEAIDTSDDNPASQLTMHILGACAEFQRKLIGAKVRESNRRRVQELGHRTQGTCPAGFRIVNGNRVPNPAEQAVLARVDELSARGFDYSEVARRLNDEDILTIRQLRGYRHAGRWTAAGVRRLTRRSATIAE
jgi:site-specific DNA recombinase